MEAERTTAPSACVNIFKSAFGFSHIFKLKLNRQECHLLAELITRA